MKKRFEQTGFARFMSSPLGRLTRIVAGLGLMILAATEKSSNNKVTLFAVGSIPLSAGVFDFCLLSPLFGGSLRGRDIRVINQPAYE